MRNMTSSLFRAVVDGRMSRVRFLLSTAGVRSGVRNDLGQNVLVAALHVQADSRRRKMFNFLLKHCAVDCETADVTTGRDVITWAAILNRPEQVRQTLEWCAGDVDLFHADYNGLSALHYAAAAGHIEIVQLLASALGRYRHSVDLRDTRFQRLTPYLYARHNGHGDVANVLVQAGASRYQFDTSVFLNGDDWEKLGRRQLRQQQLQQADSNGTQLPPSIGHKPTASVTKIDSDVLDVSPRDRQRVPVTKSTVNALFEMGKGSPGGSTVDHFMSSVSEPDSGSLDDKTESKLPALTTLMQMLSVQQSSSYCRSSRVSPPPRRGALSRRRRSQSKKKVSSFALTMNHSERQSIKHAAIRSGEQSVR